MLGANVALLERYRVSGIPRRDGGTTGDTGFKLNTVRVDGLLSPTLSSEGGEGEARSAFARRHLNSTPVVRGAGHILLIMWLAFTAAISQASPTFTGPITNGIVDI